MGSTYSHALHHSLSPEPAGPSVGVRLVWLMMLFRLLRAATQHPGSSGPVSLLRHSSAGVMWMWIVSLSNSSLGVCPFQLWLRPIWWHVGPFRHICKVTPLGVSCRSSANTRILSSEHWCRSPSQYKLGPVPASPAHQLGKHISSAYSRLGIKQWSLFCFLFPTSSSSVLNRMDNPLSGCFCRDMLITASKNRLNRVWASTSPCLAPFLIKHSSETLPCSNSSTSFPMRRSQDVQNLGWETKSQLQCCPHCLPIYWIVGFL